MAFSRAPHNRGPCPHGAKCDFHLLEAGQGGLKWRPALPCPACPYDLPMRPSPRMLCRQAASHAASPRPTPIPFLFICAPHCALHPLAPQAPGAMPLPGVVEGALILNPYFIAPFPNFNPPLPPPVVTLCILPASCGGALLASIWCVLVLVSPPLHHVSPNLPHPSTGSAGEASRNCKRYGGGAT